MNKYRVCPWYDVYKEGAPIQFYGIEIKVKGSGKYRHVCSGGKLLQFDPREAAEQRIEDLKAADASG